MRARERREFASAEPGLLFSLTFYRQLIYLELFGVKDIQAAHKHYTANTLSNKYTQPGKGFVLLVCRTWVKTQNLRTFFGVVVLVGLGVTGRVRCQCYGQGLGVMVTAKDQVLRFMVRGQGQVLRLKVGLDVRGQILGVRGQGYC